VPISLSYTTHLVAATTTTLVSLKPPVVDSPLGFGSYGRWTKRCAARWPSTWPRMMWWLPPWPAGALD
jgi:hypothetical protein